MAFKFIAFATLLTAAHAGFIAADAPLSYAAAPVAVAKTVAADDYDPHPQYNYAYEIQDGLTGDNKNQHEVRDGDVVQGSYALDDADGFRRTVEYTADPVHGFNAVVRREPLAHQKTVVAKVAAPVAYAAAPVAKLAYAAAPVAKLSYAAAPVAKLAYAAAPVAKLAYNAPVASYYH